MLKNLAVGKFGLFILTRAKLHAFGIEPLSHRNCFCFRYAAHCGVQSRLTEPLLKNAERVQEFVGNQRVVHSHAPLVEHTEDGWIVQQFLRDVGASLFRALQPGRRLIGSNVRVVVTDVLALEPLLQA